MNRTRRKNNFPVVFIASTVEDLKPRYRDAARDAAISAGILPRMMEYFAASGDKPPLGKCLEEVSKTQVVVAIIAYRYGWASRRRWSLAVQCSKRIGWNPAEIAAFCAAARYAFKSSTVEEMKTLGTGFFSRLVNGTLPCGSGDIWDQFRECSHSRESGNHLFQALVERWLIPAGGEVLHHPRQYAC